MITLADVEAAAKRLSGRVLRTPTSPVEAVSAATGADVVLKFENLQVTGAFKERGAANRLALLRRTSGRAALSRCRRETTLRRWRGTGSCWACRRRS